MRTRTPVFAGGLVGAVLAAAAILTLVAPAHALSGSAKDLTVTTNPRYHPDDALNLFARDFNVYTGATMPAGWASVDTLSVDFTDHLMWGTMTSQVWQYTDGHLLFAYQVQNTGDQYLSPGAVVMRTGNVSCFDPGWQFQDCGILDFGGDEAFDQGDVLKLTLTADSGGKEQFGFVFETLDRTGTLVTKWLAPGQTSSWFYFETNATNWQLGQATIQDGGSSADDIQVLVPDRDLGFIPEPVTLLGLAIGVAYLGGYLRRRRA